jgi:hypothetical protein
VEVFLYAGWFYAYIMSSFSLFMSLGCGLIC